MPSSSESIPVVLEANRGESERRSVNLLRMLRTQWPVMMAVVLIVTLPGLAGVRRYIKPQYTATADVRFTASTPRVMEGGQRGGDESASYDKFLNTQVSLITGNSILGKVLENADVKVLPVIARLKDPLAFLKVVIKADIERESELVRISCKMPERDTAKALVVATLAAYMDYALKEEANVGGERLRVLQGEQETRQKELDARLKHISELQQQLGMPLAAASDLGSRDTTAYRELQAKAEEDAARSGSQKELLESQVARLEQLQKEYKRDPGKPIHDFGVEEQVAADLRVIEARKDGVHAESALAQLGERYADESPQLEIERENVKSQHARVAKTEATVRGEALANVLSKHHEQLDTTRKQVEDADQRKQEFGSLIQEHQDHAMAVSKTLAALDEARMRADETRGQLRNIGDEITSIGVESNAPARVKVAAAASIPMTPERGKQLQMALAVLMLACAAAFGTAWLLEIADQRLRSVEDLAAAAGRPVLAAIPDVVLEKVPRGARAATLVSDFPETVTANEYRKVMSGVTFCDPDTLEARSCLITSPGARDGKTSVACNLGIALAETNRRVLLIDTSPACDIERNLDLLPDAGLSEVLFGGQSVSGLTRETKYPGLWVLGPGLRAARLSAKLGAREMRDLIDAAEQHFDQVLIDTPPCLVMSDAKLLASTVDGVVLVAGAGTCTRDNIHRAVTELELAGGRILGVALNGQRPDGGRYLLARLSLRRLFSRRRKKTTGATEDLPSVEELPEVEVVQTEDHMPSDFEDIIAGPVLDGEVHEEVLVGHH